MTFKVGSPALSSYILHANGAHQTFSFKTFFNLKNAMLLRSCSSSYLRCFEFIKLKPKQDTDKTIHYLLVKETGVTSMKSTIMSNDS